MFLSMTATPAVWSTTSRVGLTVRVSTTLLLLRLAFRPARTGNEHKSTPTRVMSVKPSRRPPTSNVRPAAMKALPRVVKAPRMLVTVLDLSLSVSRSAHGGRDRDSLDDFVDDVGAAASGHLGFTGRDHAMGQDGLNERLNIIGKDVVASGEGGIPPGRPKEMQAGARGGAESQ